LGGHHCEQRHFVSRAHPVLRCHRPRRRAIQYPETAMTKPIGRGVLDRPPAPARTMTAEDAAKLSPRSIRQPIRHAFAFSRRISRPSPSNSLPSRDRGRGKGRALAAPMAACRKARGRHHRFSRDKPTRPSPRDGFTVAPRSPRGPAFLPPSSACSSKHANLASAPGCQDHIAWPCVSRSFVGTNDRAATPIRPPHPASNVRDDRDTPLHSGGGMGGNIVVICPTTQAPIPATK
jgi:hypothetical protein